MIFVRQDDIVSLETKPSHRSRVLAHSYPLTSTYLVDKALAIPRIVPGLIEGASEGKGLGHQFLRHIERTALILHVVDVTGGYEGRDVVDDYRTINAELASHASELAVRPQIVVANKCDFPGTEEAVDRLRSVAEADGHQFFAVSAATGLGLDALVSACAAEVARLRSEAASSQEDGCDQSGEWERERQRRERRIDVSREERHAWRVRGVQVERMVIQTDWENDEAVAYLQHRFDRCGLDAALAKAGAVNGDEVRILDLTFTFQGTDDSNDFDEVDDANDGDLVVAGEVEN